MQEGKIGNLGSFRIVWSKLLSRRVVSMVLAGMAGLGVLFLSVMATVSPVGSASSGRVLADDRVEKAEVGYCLPNPGLLPDNPLYKFKVARDVFEGWMTTDPEDKARLTWGFADKRIRAAQALFDDGKEKEALEATMKAEQYLDQTVETEVKLHNELPKLTAAIAKHREVMNQMSKKSDGEMKQLWEKQLAKNDLMAKKIENTLAEAK